MRIASVLAFLSAAILVSGGLFKVFHWPSANIQLLVGGVLLVVALLSFAVQMAIGRRVPPAC